ncbi:MAG: DUF3108 domain-containing protein [Candidatus Auribacterota bacterium]|jgi:hypothetical protein|nr:DUF3108 domain-containing protein [Candidatus Auribacterota bacterium]
MIKLLRILPVFMHILFFICHLSYAQDNQCDYADFDRTLIEHGETLVYNAYIFGQIVPMGKAELNISKEELDGKEYYLFKGHAQGGHLIFTIDLNLEAYVDYHTLKPEFFLYRQTGFESRMRKLDFKWETGEIVYFKRSNETEPYVERARTPMQPHTRDILSTLYFARSIEPVIGATKVMRLIEKRDIWTVDVVVTDKKELTASNGKKYNALLIKILPRQTGNNEMFQGLFGLKGDISLWVTEERRIPVQIEGDYPLGFFNLPITVVLHEWYPQTAIPVFNSEEK